MKTLLFLASAIFAVVLSSCGVAVPMGYGGGQCYGQQLVRRPIPNNYTPGPCNQSGSTGYPQQGGYYGGQRRIIQPQRQYGPWSNYPGVDYQGVYHAY